MKKNVILKKLDEESERLLNSNSKQRKSEGRNLKNFIKVVEKSNLQNVNIEGDMTSTNIGIIAISLLQTYINKTTKTTFDFINEQTITFKNGCYQLASIVKSRSAEPHDTKGLKAFIYLIYTPTVKGVYKVDKDIILNAHNPKIPASFIKQHGKLLREL